MAGTLYIVPTPVGNLADMTPRAVETLREADLVLAEDTRTSGVLMQHFGIDTPLVSHHKYNEHATVAELVRRIKGGERIALVSDAGTPGISDPGFLLSRECREAGLPVVTLPGATAFVPALVNSGLPCDRFCFEGFLPPKKGRQTRLTEIAAESRTTVIYESPLRLVRTLTDLATACGPERAASVSREISKLHEETVRGTLDELVQHFTQNQPRGEIVIVLKGNETPKERKTHTNKYKTFITDGTAVDDDR
ncbi:MAG: 16S rRNA (cytidine(1402)-2'-O)-methyltransferase [Candidatus Amulumruptor caecigallinarius]|nr:16S rRNA (cytidine(1402)-2'-O)-methyltransferase [Candidatus Amulumruptor caecigallinarius]MCM1396166.1 16S rRNA (cytidine(1402)-2'-O)-methyltransferase [Candidatus Amulumruptor caecigallinarius]MCM1453834.1 16S rRNA (cytidine(1402)-2'-O)-methyltransferase [bacterium]